MSESYESAMPDETVFVSGIGNMTLRAAVRRFLHARDQGSTVTLYRELGKSPGTFDAVDVALLARLKRFKAAR